MATKFWRGFVLSVVAVAATTAGAMAQDDKQATYIARGNEPFWSVLIADGQISVTRMGGKGVDAWQLPPAEKGAAAGETSYVVANGPTLTIAPGICRDTMTGMPYPDRVTLKDEDGEVTGCGGDPMSLLTGDEWQVTMIGGAPVPDSVKPTVTFLPDGRIAGSSGCNRYTGSVSMNGEGLALSPLAMTRMACSGDADSVERSFTAAIGQITGFNIADDGALTLLAGDTPLIVARR